MDDRFRRHDGGETSYHGSKSTMTRSLRSYKHSFCFQLKGTPMCISPQKSAAIVLIAVMGCLTGCGGATGGNGGGGATPEQTFEKFKSAMKSKDYATGFQQLTPDTQDMMLGSMVIAAGFISAFDPKGSEMQQVLDKHGVQKIDMAA